ncbi:3-isopropylmalate dehydrogenase [Vagococcus bubulae]|uniref:3-isopropylmalate dehydrogenase n=1 Tax=Vagococcus bubulae TaxID=1977868 RepID=A0A429ZK73_9ENTE|nr:3-isopropylmalate dehydrogenase [Vagococcus bubulae]RST94082.1 3-isopropylmalate dehydrogenase [Vagococcus bubulae]
MTKITVLKGDGIGPEIMDAGLNILSVFKEKGLFDYEISEELVGGAAIDAVGKPLPEKTVESCQSSDAILLGAIGGPKWDDCKERPEAGLLALRKQLSLYANIRPIQVSEELVHLSPIKEDRIAGTDFVIVRELTGGIYFGEPRQLNDTEALDTCVYTKEEIERIMRAAFELAQTRRKKVTSVDKSNVLATSKLWRKVAEEVSQDYPDVTLEHQLVDSCAMVMITKPKEFDVIVTENMFGDILSDEASVLTGSLGVLASSSLSKTGIHLFEPIHGSAPDIAGQNVANPLSMIYSVTMMLRDSFKQYKLADMVDEAVKKVMQKGIMTKDLGGNYSTTDVTKYIREELIEIIGG